MACFGPWIGEHQIGAIEAAIRQGLEQLPRVIWPDPEVIRRGDGVFLAFRHNARHERAQTVFEDFRSDIAHVRIALRLVERVLTPAEPDFEPDFIDRRAGKGGFRV
ncbi:hypothetical protein JCM15831A_26270 [Asaia astilbis]